jgi:enolase
MSATAITAVSAFEGFSDRGFAAVFTTVKTENGAVGTAIWSQGESMGSHEPPCVYDNGKKWRGRGLSIAVRNVNEIVAPALIGLDAANQPFCDSVILALGRDRIGNNASAAASMAVLKAGAAALGLPLYRHIGGQRAFTLPVPSYMVVSGSTRYGAPVGFGYVPTYSYVAYDFDSYSEASYALWEVVTNWGDYLTKKLGTKFMHNANGAIPNGKVKDDYQIWDMLTENLTASGYEGKVGLQVDLSANSFYNKESGLFEGLLCRKPKTREELIEIVIDMPKKYPFIIIEDPLSEDDVEGFAKITSQVDIQIVGDDLFAGNKERVEAIVHSGAANAILISPNKCGAVSEAYSIAQLATQNNRGIVSSPDRGEGWDACDFAVGLNCGTARELGLSFPGNRFLKIEAELGARAKFFGRSGIRGGRFQLR